MLDNESRISTFCFKWLRFASFAKQISFVSTTRVQNSKEEDKSKIVVLNLSIWIMSPKKSGCTRFCKAQNVCEICSIRVAKKFEKWKHFWQVLLFKTFLICWSLIWRWLPGIFSEIGRDNNFARKNAALNLWRSQQFNDFQTQKRKTFCSLILSLISIFVLFEVGLIDIDQWSGTFLLFLEHGTRHGFDFSKVVKNLLNYRV